jgi:hypothetical protein
VAVDINCRADVRVRETAVRLRTGQPRTDPVLASGFWRGLAARHYQLDQHGIGRRFRRRRRYRREQASDHFLGRCVIADARHGSSCGKPDGSIAEEPVMRLMPKDVTVLIDRLQVLFDRPSVISQHQGLTVSTELSADALSEFIEATRGRAGPSRIDVSPLPRTRRFDD